MEATATAVVYNFTEMQAEQVAWSLKNFGNSPVHRPLLGIIEELGELQNAWNKKDKPEIIDAVGDVGIYMLAFCGKKGWDLQEFWDTRQVISAAVLDGYWDVVPLMRACAHSQLKGEQNIRGGTAVHDEAMKCNLRCILWQLEEIAKSVGSNFGAIITEVWAKVCLRDWTKNPNTAHAVAEEESASSEEK